MSHVSTPAPFSRRGVLRPAAAAVAVGTFLVLALAGCSSSDDAGKDAVTPTATGSASAAVAAAQAEVTKLLQAPTSIGVTEPLKSAPAKGGTLVFLSCENGLCQVLAKGMGTAAKAAGLEYKNQPIKLADPATLIAGMQQALEMNPKPVGVAFAGIPEAVWGSQAPAFQKAGVPLIPIAVGETTASPVVPAGSLDGPADARAQASAIANFFIADSQGRGKSLIVNVPDVGSLKIVTDQYVSTVKSGCPDCSVGTVDVTLAQVGGGQVVPAVVSALQRNRDVKYVVTVQGEFTQGLQAAVKAAGLPDVQLLGINPAKFNQQQVQTGEAKAFTLLPFNIMAWKAVDVALRYAQGMSVEPGDGALPLQLLTKETVGSPQDSIDRPEDYEQQFKKLWKVG
ncbi:sugar ABC transporter substrate-binding protein [Candidatus Protofrankia californiensis]|uniref:sugar ABC transporter substrate-binding protein n=1 Tax=Candidatus Protofrankia californiensis TaxID=1839754 RepID=UPI001F49360E|nr:substrate-binding domain-containing protein [Candidatus Protofrankia californiensis]